MSPQIHSEQKRKVVADAVRDNPSVPSRQLARMIFKQHGMLWSSWDSCYQSVRSARGAHGAMRRERCVQRGTTPPPAMPKSQCKAWPVFKLEAERTLVLADLHFPFHDEEAIECALQEGKRRDVDCILLNGDVCDFFSASKHERNPTESTLVQEVQATREFLRYIRHKFPKAQIIFKEGNHDEWFERYICRKAPELLGLSCLDLEYVLTGPTKTELAIGGITWVADQRKIMAGKLNILHGHEYGKGSIAPAVNPARGAFLRLVECALVGHLHRASQHDETSANGKLISCWSSGCLCGLWPKYARINKWNHGATYLELHRGDFSITQLRILNGRLL